MFSRGTGDIGKTYSEVSQPSEMELFANIIHSWKPPTIIRKQLHLRCLTEFWIHPHTGKCTRLKPSSTQKCIKQICLPCSPDNSASTHIVVNASEILVAIVVFLKSQNILLFFPPCYILWHNFVNHHPENHCQE